MTEAFPQVADAVRAAPHALVLDGEIIAVTPAGDPRPFQALQPRLRKSRPGAEDLAETRVALVAFDLLLDDTGPLLAAPWTERRARLEALAARLGEGALRLNPATRLPAGEPLDASVDSAFRGARARGHEGLVLEARRGALRRGPPRAGVDQGEASARDARRGGGRARRRGTGGAREVLSDYTFAVLAGRRVSSPSARRTAASRTSEYRTP